jgi:hypothetical protein
VELLRRIMPAKSRAQIGYIMTHQKEFGGKAKVKKEWLDPTKGKKLPKRVKNGKAVK